MANPTLNRADLVVWTWPEVRESPHSWILRLTEANRFPSPRWITGRATHLLATEWLAIAAGHASSTPPDDAIRMKAHVWRFGTALPRAYLRLGRPLVCPACLAEEAICPAEWDLLFYTTCARHGCDMVGTCPAGHPLTWDRRAVCACADRRCRADLRVARLTSSDRIELLRDATPLEWIGAIRLFGDLATLRRGYPLNGDLVDPTAAVRRSATLLHGWPETFRPWLSANALPGEEILAARRLNTRAKRMEGRGQIPTRLAQAIRVAMHSLFFDVPEWSNEPSEASSPYPDLSMRDAAASLGLQEFELAAMIEAGRVETVARLGRGNGLRVPASEVERLSIPTGAMEVRSPGPRLAFVSLRQAAKHLGIGTKLTAAMLDAGLLEQVATGRGRKVVRVSLHDLLLRLERASSHDERQRGEGWQAWDVVSRHTTCAGLMSLVSATLQGRACLRRRPGDYRGLQAFEFLVGDEHAVPGLRAIGTRELRRILRCQQRDPGRLLASGALCLDQRGRRNTCAKRAGFDATSVTAFDRVYASTAKLAAEAAVTTRAMLAALRGSGIVPMLAAEADGAAFWNRSEAAAIIKKLQQVR